MNVPYGQLQPCANLMMPIHDEFRYEFFRIAMIPVVRSRVIAFFIETNLHFRVTRAWTKCTKSQVASHTGIISKFRWFLLTHLMTPLFPLHYCVLCVTQQVNYLNRCKGNWEKAPLSVQEPTNNSLFPLL